MVTHFRSCLQISLPFPFSCSDTLIRCSRAYSNYTMAMEVITQRVFLRCRSLICRDDKTTIFLTKVNRFNFILSK